MMMRSTCPDDTGTRLSTIRRGVMGTLSATALAALLLAACGDALAHVTPQVIPLVPPASNSTQVGFIRVVNRSDSSGSVSIEAIDDTGERFDAITLSLGAKESVNFSSTDLEQGNSSKGLSGGVGDGEGNWRLELSSDDLDFEALAYIQTGNGFLTSMHDVVAAESRGRYRVPMFNPESDTQQTSRLRLINPGTRDVDVTIAGLDDEGTDAPDGDVTVSLPAGEARMLTAAQLESGDDDDDEIDGQLGDGDGKWTLFVSAEHPIQVMSLLLNEDGNLTNLSGTPYEPHADLPICNDELTVEGNDEGHGTLETAVSLGNLTEVATVRARAGMVNSESNENGYYRFTLDDTRTMRLELRNLTRNADLYLLNQLGQDVYYSSTRSTNGGTFDESIVWTLDAGTYFVRVQAKVDGDLRYQIRYSNDSRVPRRRIPSAFDLGDLSEVKVVRALEHQINATRNETCRFHRAYYRFTLDDTRTMRFELRNLTRNADLYLLNQLGQDVYYSSTRSTNGGTFDESIVWTLDAGTYYIQVEAETTSTSDTDYELLYSNDSRVPGRTRSSAFDLGDLTDVMEVRTRSGEINPARNETALFLRHYYGFTVADTRTMRFELHNLTGNADLYLLNQLGQDVYYSSTRSTNSGTFDESILWTLDAGTYFIRVEAATTSTRTISYELRYGPGS